MLVVAVVSVYTYPFLATSHLTCHGEDAGISISCWAVPSDSKETELG